MKMKERDKQSGKGHLEMNTPPIVSQQEWEAAHQQLLVKEKAFTRSRDALAAERRRMPWTPVGMNGTATTCSSATASGCSVRTSSTTEATRRWGPSGATSTSPRSVVK